MAGLMGLRANVAQSAVRGGGLNALCLFLDAQLCTVLSSLPIAYLVLIKYL